MPAWLLPLVGSAIGFVGGAIQKAEEHDLLADQIDQINKNIDRAKRRYEALLADTKQNMLTRAGNIESAYMLTTNQAKEAGLMSMHNQALAYGTETLRNINQSLAELEMKYQNSKLPDKTMSILSGAFQGLGAGMNAGLDTQRAWDLTFAGSPGDPLQEKKPSTGLIEIVEPSESIEDFQARRNARYWG